MSKEMTKELLEQLDKVDKVAVRFTADWCGPCKQFAPTFDKVGDEFNEISKVVINVGDNYDIAQSFGVLGIPAVLFLNKGQVVSLMAGNQPTEAVREQFQKLKDS